MKTFYSSVSSWLKAASLTAMAAMLAVNVSAAGKSYDFTKWSAATVANIKADRDAVAVTASGDNAKREWSDIEKTGSVTYDTDNAKDNCFWKWGTQGSTSEKVSVKANGTAIAELQDLYYVGTSGGKLAVAVNYSSTSLGTYQGPSYLWFNGGGDYMVIPNVTPGEIIKIGIESHKPAEGRGVELYPATWVDGKFTKGSTKFTAPDGSEVPKPTTYVEQSWIVPENPAATNEDGTVDVCLTATSGCHLYYIIVGDGGGDVVVEAKNIAYVTAASEFDEIGTILEGASDQFAVTTIMSDSEVKLDSLQKFEAVVISGFVGVTDPIVAELRKAVAYVPVLNLNADLVKEWGLASIVDGPSTLTVPENMTANALFNDIDLSEGLAVFAEGAEVPAVPALVLDKYFANDKILALAGENVGIHQHNTRNSYMYLPWRDLATNEAVYSTLVLNAAAVVANTKSAVSVVGKPSFTLTYENLNTDVKIASANEGAVIYYTTDGTDPTTSSNVYTDPLNFKAETVVKAYAVLDGYYDSEIAVDTIKIMEKAAAPSINLAYADSATTITMSSDAVGAQIYYTFKEGVTDYKACAPYTEPIVLTVEPGTVYAFVREKNDSVAKYVGSDVASVDVAIKHITKDNIRLDVVSEYSCDEASWKTNPRVDGDASDSKTYYPWGKKAWDYFDTETILSKEPVVDEDGNPVLDENGEQKYNITYADKADRLKYAYATNEAATEYAKQWRLYSEGQVLVHEFTNNPSYQYTDGASEGRYFDRPEDMIGNMATKGHLSFKGKPSGAPYCAGIESVVPFDAPFDVVVLAGNAAGKEGNQLDLSLSTDGENWTKVHDIVLSPTKQVIRKDRYSVNEPGKWYVRVGQTKGSNDIHMYNLYILNNGEKSQLYDGQTGIEEVIAGNEAAEVVAVEVYNLNGYRLAKAERGVNIIRTVYADGTVKVEKVIVK